MAPFVSPIHFLWSHKFGLRNCAASTSSSLHLGKKIETAPDEAEFAGGGKKSANGVTTELSNPVSMQPPVTSAQIAITAIKNDHNLNSKV